MKGSFSTLHFIPSDVAFAFKCLPNLVTLRSVRLYDEAVKPDRASLRWRSTMPSSRISCSGLRLRIRSILPVRGSRLAETGILTNWREFLLWR